MSTDRLFGLKRRLSVHTVLRGGGAGVVVLVVVVYDFSRLLTRMKARLFILSFPRCKQSSIYRWLSSSPLQFARAAIVWNQQEKKESNKLGREINQRGISGGEKDRERVNVCKRERERIK